MKKYSRNKWWKNSKGIPKFAALTVQENYAYRNTSDKVFLEKK